MAKIRNKNSETTENKRLFGLKIEFCNSVKFYVILDNILRQNFL